jgi:glycosyltransferase involved in cell wall biosynthesis
MKQDNIDLTVLMAVNKLDEFLDLSIRSILEQTYHYFYFFIVTNGPNCSRIAAYITEKFSDDRIHIVQLELEGLAFALNYGVNLSKTKYIARQDADDISDANRFQEQFDFLESNLDYSIVGSKVTLIDEKGNHLPDPFFYVQNDHLIKRVLSIHNPLCHPSLMFRRTHLLQAKGYLFGYFSEDHDLFIRMAKLPHSKFHNIDKELFKYRRHSTQLTSSINRKLFAEISAIHLINLISRGNIKSLVGILWVFPPVVFIKRLVRKIIRCF